MMSLKKLSAVLAVTLPLIASAQTAATNLKFKFSGDLNNRANIYTDQLGLFRASETIAGTPVSKDSLTDSWAEFKYRFQFEGATEDNSIRAVYNIELGAIRFGDGGTKNVGTDAIGTNGGGYSGDGDNYETRFAYLDFGLPGNTKSRITIGLQPFLVNHYLWEETATGVQFKGDMGPAKLTLAWMRGREIFPTKHQQDAGANGDNYLIRGDFVPNKDLKAGVFGLYQHQNPETGAGALSYQLKRFGVNTVYDIGNVGVDGSLNVGDIFVKFDAIYQNGRIQLASGNNKLSAFFGHADVGVNVGQLKLTYTGWYATGDDKPTDTKVKNFISTDVDMFDSVVLFEGGYTDDNYFTEAPHFLNFGAIFNKVAADFKARPNVTIGAAAMYIMTAKSIPLAGGKKSDKLGTEFDAYVSYKPYSQLELAVNAGYLLADDAMDAFEAAAIQNGKSDSNVFRATARARFIF